MLDIKPYILQYDAPPLVASHFTGPARVVSSTETENGGVDSIVHEDRLHERKYKSDSNQEENAPKCFPDEGYFVDEMRHLEETHCHESSEKENEPKNEEGVCSLITEGHLGAKYNHDGSKEENKCKCNKHGSYVINENKPYGSCWHEPSHCKNKSHGNVSESQLQTEMICRDDNHIKITECQILSTAQESGRTEMEVKHNESLRYLDSSSEKGEKVRESKTLPAHGGVRKALNGQDKENMMDSDEYTRKREIKYICDGASESKECGETEKMKESAGVNTEAVHAVCDKSESDKCPNGKPSRERSNKNQNGNLTNAQSQNEEGDEKRDEVKGKDVVLMASWVSEPPTVTLQVLFNPIAEEQMQAFSRQAKAEQFRYVIV